MRFLSAAALLCLLLVFNACVSVGSGGDDDFAKYDAQEVEDRFEELTGVEMESSSLRGDELTSLRPEIDSRGNRGYRRYSGVTIYVATKEDALDSVKKLSSDDERQFDNVLVKTQSSTSESEDSFERTVRVLSSLGKPASAARLAPEDTLCERQDIDAESGDGKEGECIDDDQRPVTVVNADSDLEVEGAIVSDVEVSTGRRLVSRQFGTTRTRRATGEFVVLRYELSNTGDEPLNSLRPGLLVDGKRFSEDTRTRFDIGSSDGFPLQPGATTRGVTVFDVPDSIAGEVDEGALEIPVTEDGLSSSVEFAELIGRVRLEGAAKGPQRFGSARLSG